MTLGRESIVGVSSGSFDGVTCMDFTAHFSDCNRAHRVIFWLRLIVFRLWRFGNCWNEVENAGVVCHLRQDTTYCHCFSLAVQQVQRSCGSNQVVVWMN